MNGAEAIIAALTDCGTEVVFGYPGAAILAVYDALYKNRDRLRHVLSVNEQSAGHAADGYARVSGRTGVVLATSGPGATNLVTALATSFHDSIPVVAITGNVDRELIGRDSFQEVDITGITNPITKHNFMVRGADMIYSTVREAFIIANSGRKGPVLVDIPHNLLSEEAEPVRLPHFQPRELPFPHERELDAAAQLISEAKRPLILCGGGVVFSDSSKSIKSLSELLGAPVCHTLMGVSALPSDDPMNLGLIGLYGTYTACVAVNTCDVLIAAGTRFSDRVTRDFNKFAYSAKIVHIDVDGSEISKNVEAYIGLVGSADAVTDELCRRIPQHEPNEWTKKLLNIRLHHPRPEPPIDSFEPGTIIRKIYRRFGRDIILVTDVGQHQLFAAQYGEFLRPRSFISSCGLGTMGYGLGAAEGAKIAAPDRHVVLISGDGSFHMNMGELAAAVTENLKLDIFIMNNSALGMVYQWQKALSGTGAYTDISRRTDYATAAEAFGARGFRAECCAELEEAFDEILSTDKLCVVDCRIDHEQTVENLNLEY